jgi:hypothetical protein
LDVPAENRLPEVYDPTYQFIPPPPDKEREKPKDFEPEDIPRF